jgi:tetratricopeptide (TPR) repeat protein
LARRAAELGADDAFALSAAASCFAFILGDLDTGAALNDLALALNPNLAFIWGTSGWLKVQLGDPETAIEHLARGMRLSPFDPYMFDLQAATAYAHYYAGRFIEALSSAEAATRAQPNYGPALKVLAASGAMAGRHEVAQRAIARLCELQPALRISNATEYLCPRRPEHLASWQEGLRKAGLPE